MKSNYLYTARIRKLSQAIYRKNNHNATRDDDGARLESALLAIIMGYTELSISAIDMSVYGITDDDRTPYEQIRDAMCSINNLCDCYKVERVFPEILRTTDDDAIICATRRYMNAVEEW